MRGPQALADVLRVVARGLAILLLPVIAFYLIFVGLQLAYGEPGFLGMFLNLILLLLLGLGLIVAWRREGLGAMLALGALAGFLVPDALDGSQEFAARKAQLADQWVRHA